MNTDNRRRLKSIDHVLKEERKSYLGAIGQQNAEEAKKNCVVGPGDLGSTVSIPDNYNGRPKNNNPKNDSHILMASLTAKRIADNAILDVLKASQKVNTDDFCRPTTIAPVPKQARKSNLDVCRRHNAEEAKKNCVVGLGDLGPTISISDNYNGRAKSNNPKYDPQIFMSSRTAKRIGDNAILDNLKVSQKINTDDFSKPTTIVPVPKQARKSNLDVIRQHNADQANQNRVIDPNDVISAVSISDNYNGRPKNNGSEHDPEKSMSKHTEKDISKNAKVDYTIARQTVNTDGFHTPTKIVPVPKQARKNNNNLDVFEHRNAEQADQNRIGDPINFASTAWIPDKYNDRPKSNGQKYDLDLLMHTRVIRSGDVRKSTLIKRDESARELSTDETVEDDETFFANLKKRILEDLQKNITKKAPDTSPKRLSKPRKIKTLLDNETRSLMNKFREEFALNRSKQILSEENGLFSMERRSSNCTREDVSDQPHPTMSQNVVERGVKKNISKEHFETDVHSLRDRSPFNEINAGAYNDQPIPSSSENTRMKRRSNTWTREDIREQTHPTMSQNVVECGMKKNISKKHFETDDHLLRDRSHFNETHTEAFNDQPIPSSSQNTRMFSMKRRSNTWTREDIREHAHPAVSQNVVERGMKKNISKNHFETDDGSIRGRSPFNEINAETYNDQPKPSPSERNRMFSVKRRSSSWNREGIREHTNPAISQNVERTMTKDISMKLFETDEDSLRDRSPFNRIKAEDYNDQQTSSQPERNRMFSVKRRSSSWNREGTREHTNPAMSQNVVERTTTKDISLKLFETDEDSFRDRSPFNRINAEDYSHQPTLSPPERNGMFSVKRRSNSWTREDIREHTNPAMSQNLVERTMTKDISLKLFKTDEDSFRDRSPFNRINAEDYNDQPTPSPPEGNGMFSMERRSNSWTREDICELAHLVMPQNVVESRTMNDVMWETCEIHAEDYYRQPTPSSSQRNDVFSLEHRNNFSTRENICEHRQPAMPQYVVERMTNDISTKYSQNHENSLRDRPDFNEIQPEVYSRQPIILSSGYPLGDCPTIQYY